MEKKLAVQSVGIVVENLADTLTDTYFSEIIHGLIVRLTALQINIRFIQQIPEQYYDVSHLQGLLIVGKPSKETLDRALSFHFPTVLVGCPTPARTVTHVYFDHLTGFQELTEYVLQCNHRHIALINGGGGAEGDLIWKEMLRGFEQGIKTLLAREQKHIRHHIFHTDYIDIQTVEIAVLKILALKPAITCLMCSNDRIAYFCYQVLVKHKLRVPQEISITGFDGIVSSSTLLPGTPSLTTVVTNRDRLGYYAVDLLIDHFKKKSHGNLHNRLLIGQLRVGDSVRRIQHR